MTAIADLDVDRLTEQMVAGLTERNPTVVDDASRLLVRKSAAIFATQDQDELKKLASGLGAVSQAAKAFADGSESSQWRALAEVAALLSRTPQRLAIDQWFSDKTKRGQVLRLVSANPGIKTKDIREKISVSAQSLANMLKALEEANLIRRLRSGAAVHVYLTASCRSRLKELSPILSASELTSAASASASVKRRGNDYVVVVHDRPKWADVLQSGYVNRDRLSRVGRAPAMMDYANSSPAEDAVESCLYRPFCAPEGLALEEEKSQRGATRRKHHRQAYGLRTEQYG